MNKQVKSKQVWTEDKEKQWYKLTEERERNKQQVGKLHTIEILQKMIDSLKKGKEDPFEINIEYIRGDVPYGYDGIAPVIGKKITLIYK